MDYVLDPVDDYGAGEAWYVDDALHAQHVLAPAVQQHGAPDAKRGPIDGLVEREARGGDALVVAVGASLDHKDSMAGTSEKLRAAAQVHFDKLGKVRA